MWWAACSAAVALLWCAPLRSAPFHSIPSHPTKQPKADADADLPGLGELIPPLQVKKEDRASRPPIPFFLARRKGTGDSALHTWPPRPSSRRRCEERFRWLFFFSSIRGREGEEGKASTRLLKLLPGRDLRVVRVIQDQEIIIISCGKQ